MRSVAPGMCLVCGYSFDCASAIANPHAEPAPGDLTVCLSCGNLMMFDDALRIVQASESHLDTVEPLQRRVFELARKFILKRGPMRRREVRN